VVQSEADPAWSWMTSIVLAVLVGCIYILSAKMSLALLTPDGVAVFWPAAGIAAGTLMALGPHARWPVVAGTMTATLVANLLGDRNVLSSVVFAFCNAGEALLAAGIIHRFFGWPFKLDRLRQVLGLVGAAMVATAVSGVGGALGFVVFHDANGSIFVTWQNWFASDALGIVTIAPMIIGLASIAREPPGRSEAMEGFIALASLIVMSIIVAALPQAPWAKVVPIALLFPILLWIAARCPPFFAAAAAFVVTLAIVGTTTIEVGLFGSPDVPMAERVLTARAGIIAVALCAYVLAALFAERRQQAAALTESEARVQEALTAGAVTTFVWDLASRKSLRSANAAQLLGFTPEEVFTPTDFLARVHAEDRGRFRALVHGLKPDHADYNFTFRFKRADDRVVWLEETAKAEFDGVGRLVRLKGLTLDVTARKQSLDQQSLVVAELDQRVQKLMARLAFMAKDMGAHAGSLDAYIRALDQRIESLADAYALLSRNRWRGAELAELVRRQLAPRATEANAVIHGPDVILTVETTQALTMVLHELVTNAAAYGALASPHGRVEVSWSLPANADRLTLEWQEIGGPAVAPSPELKYGVGIIRDVIPRELGGSVDLAFASSGVRCRIEVPLKDPRRIESKTAEHSAELEHAP
jgi:PAS domain S-box-containing protein